MCNHVCCSASGVAHSIIAAVPLALLSSPARLRSISNYFEIKFQFSFIFFHSPQTCEFSVIRVNVWKFLNQLFYYTWHFIQTFLRFRTSFRTVKM